MNKLNLNCLRTNSVCFGNYTKIYDTEIPWIKIRRGCYDGHSLESYELLVFPPQTKSITIDFNNTHILLTEYVRTINDDDELTENEIKELSQIEELSELFNETTELSELLSECDYDIHELLSKIMKKKIFDYYNVYKHKYDNVPKYLNTNSLKHWVDKNYESNIFNNEEHILFPYYEPVGITEHKYRKDKDRCHYYKIYNSKIYINDINSIIEHFYDYQHKIKALFIPIDYNKCYWFEFE